MMTENLMSPIRIRFWAATTTVMVFLAVGLSTPFIIGSPAALLWTRMGTYAILLVLGIVGLRQARYRQYAVGMLIGCGVLLLPLVLLIANLVLTGSVM